MPFVVFYKIFELVFHSARQDDRIVKNLISKVGVEMSNEIQSVARTFTIIEYLSKSARAMSLKEISTACSLPLTTTHRLLNSLCSLDYATNESNGHYRLSYKLFEVSSKIVSQTNLISIAKPILDDLSERLGESVHLVVRSGNNIVYVYKVVCAIGSIQMASRIGMTLPMYRCAVGKVILSTLDDAEIIDIFNSSEIVATGPNTIVNLEKFLEEINRIRQLGYAVDDEENEKGIKCVAVSLACKSENASYAFSVSSIKSRLPEPRVRKIAEIMLEVKTKIENMLI